MENLQQIKKDIKERLLYYNYDETIINDIINNIICVVRPGVVLVNNNGRKIEMFL